jgi:signal transduction histidine kinase
MALTPEILIPRLGDVLVEQGLLSNEDLEAALEQQREMRKTGQAPLIGQLLVDMGKVDRATMDQAITVQIIRLQHALQESNELLEKRVEERTAALQRAYEKLTELSKLKENFVSNISHELRTPLTHLKGYLDLMLSNDFGPITLEQKNALDVMDRATERLGRLIDDLILFSTSESGNIHLQIQSFDLVPQVNAVIEQNSAQARHKNIHLWLNEQNEPPKVKGDPERIQWVINQLVDNAIKFTEKDGEVCIRLTRGEKDVLITVLDTGIGIDSSKLEEIFEPFHQLDGSSTRRQGGTGLGLALVKKIVEAHNSKIEVQSTPEKGSRFEFRLKVADPG